MIPYPTPSPRISLRHYVAIDHVDLTVACHADIPRWTDGWAGSRSRLMLDDDAFNLDRAAVHEGWLWALDGHATTGSLPDVGAAAAAPRLF
ncbi:hypothetical protein ACIA5H_31315 [Nocardia sp. NPDC051900]|uniref:hypothetical protein n=1 Tax=Nocardia sp. NPDC051900 TaxID=3364326 RepID=UPI0037A37323